MVAMWARAAVWLTCLAVGQASSEHAAATTTAGDWTPRKPYAESIAFPQVPLFGQSSGSLAGTLFERQSGKLVWRVETLSVLTVTIRRTMLFYNRRRL
jgi:hypothetical protein